MPPTALTLRGDGLDGVTALSALIHEQLSTPTRAEVEVTAPMDLDWDAQMGRSAVLEVAIAGRSTRSYHLVIVGARVEGAATQGGEATAARVTLDLAHELSVLSMRADVRMFQAKNAQQIVEEVLRGAGVEGAHYSFSLRRAPVERAYCVQYRETDLSFIARMLEEEGIFYRISDDDASTKVTFEDTSSALSAIEDSLVRFIGADTRGAGIMDFMLEAKVVPARAAVGDYNFETPGVTLLAGDAAKEGGPGEHYAFWTGHTTPDQGAALAKLRREQIAAQATVGRGRSTVPSFIAGAWFELEGTSRAGLSQRYLLTSVEHHVTAHEAARTSYENTFSCIPYETPFRPPLSAPKPRVYGVQPVVVTGPRGSEIHTDAFGRMKAKFFWDRVGEDDDTSSFWMRVAELPIGGSMALARVGWEMGVTFIAGDPDRPVAVTRLYNAEKTSPYDYPAAKTRMALQTPSSPGGGKSNELRMEDGSSGMELFLNASKDLDGQVNNNMTETIGVDESLKVGSSRETAVGANQTIAIGGDMTSTIGAAESTSVSADRNKSVGGSETVSVSKGIEIHVTGSDTESTGGSHTTLTGLGVTKSSSSAQSLTVGGSLVTAAGAGVGVAVAGAKSETVGGVKLSLSGASVSESVVGALALTVGGVIVQASAANRAGSTKGPAAITAGGVACVNAGKKVMITGKKVAIRVAGLANFLGGGGVLNMTAGSASFVGLVTLDASGSVTISGNPNLAG